MKEIRETKMVEQTTVQFIANDGKVFEGEDAKYECNCYERTLTETAAKAELIKMGVKFFDMPFGGWIGYDYELCFAELKSEEDFILMKSALDKLYHPYENNISKPESYPSKMIISISSDDVYVCDMSSQTLKRYLQQAKDLFSFEKLEDFLTVPEVTETP